MRFVVVFALLAFLAISAVRAFPSTDSGSDQGSSIDQPVIRPFPCWPWPNRFGFRPVVLSTAPTKAVT
ncbi:uncharacterized protein LOC108136082 [Drosophila elegans]|uniref:uncharacterized protein LOC108136082 n=1 Tax=Drosophila elegans TaxID=30023 RepID=UPI0007E5EA4A|nr:uncharacterized protein LOC108136082 [Drosophila elegans]